MLRVISDISQIIASLFVSVIIHTLPVHIDNTPYNKFMDGVIIIYY